METTKAAPFMAKQHTQLVIAWVHRKLFELATDRSVCKKKKKLYRKTPEGWHLLMGRMNSGNKGLAVYVCVCVCVRVRAGTVCVCVETIVIRLEQF